MGPRSAATPPWPAPSPSALAPVLIRLSRGRPLRVIAREGGFARDQDLGSGHIGWVAGKRACCVRPAAIASARMPIAPRRLWSPPPRRASVPAVAAPTACRASQARRAASARAPRPSCGQPPRKRFRSCAGEHSATALTRRTRLMAARRARQRGLERPFRLPSPAAADRSALRRTGDAVEASLTSIAPSAHAAGVPTLRPGHLRARRARGAS